MKPLRVRILSYHFSDNYGAVLQAYALREWLRRRGVEAEFINYHPRYVEEGGSFDNLLDPHKWKKNLTIAYLKASHLFDVLFGSRQQRKAFEDFQREHLGVVGPRLLQATDLNNIGEVDLFICGSDQIWNPSAQNGLDPVYFLDFSVGVNARRVSYAASFGKASLAAEYHVVAGELISQLDAISVREESGVEIVRTVSGCEAWCVPDPTVLLGAFDDLVSRGDVQEKMYVFCYALRTAKIIREVAEHIAQAQGLNIISPRTVRQRWLPIGNGVVPGPAEWLSLLNSSAMVVTNSFHGVALSIVLNRPFIAVSLPGKRGELNERVGNLLTHTGLLERVVRTANPDEIDGVIARPIDWAVVNHHLASLQEHGCRFLEDQLTICGWHKRAEK